MANDDLFDRFTDQLRKRSQQVLESESIEWFVNKIQELAKLNRLRLQEIAEASPGLATELPTISATATAGLSSVPPKSVLQQQTSLISQNVGQMMLYQYDPKLKKELPYYDTFPLIFPISLDGQHLMGLNMHYLPIAERIQFLQTLMNLASTKELNEKTKLNISYSILKNASMYRAYKPCLKKYLINHVQSQYMIIKPNEWASTIALPLAQFQKQSQWKVWSDSIKKMYK